MTGSIYLLTSTKTPKVYVGQTRKTLQERLQEHIYAAHGKNKSLIYRAMRKYGETSFQITLLEELPDCTIEQLNAREIYWITQYKANNRAFGYNLTEGGGGCNGLSSEIRQHLSEVRRGHPKWTAEQKAERAQIMKERWASLSATERALRCKHISESQKGKPGNRIGATNSAEHRARISASRKGQISNNKGKTFSEEHKRKIGEANKGHVCTDAERQKRREAALRRHARERLTALVSQ
jgi:group I intron endonuclease